MSNQQAALLEIKDLCVSVEGKEILKGVNLTIRAGEVHAIMGLNGSGKTTLAYTLMGHPKYKVTSGEILLDGESIQEMSPDERAKARLFLGFQYPVAIPGVTVANFLRSSVRAVRGDEVPAKEVRKLLKSEAKKLNIPDEFFTRYLNDGFSGGEKKRLEILQMRVLDPKVAILDETDSGLDIDALKQVAQGIQESRKPENAFLLVTHYQRMLNYVQPDFVHIFMDGEIKKSGGADLALELEEKGYDHVSSVTAS